MYTLQGNYGSGWEDLISENTREDILERLDEYLENDNYANGFRIVPERNGQ